ncbi:E3 ubiquitin-protein ligase SDIR1 [Prunus persica]|nr:E3 ubiquitin-protein ligase SDIR1 [Prunus persica]
MDQPMERRSEVSCCCRLSTLAVIEPETDLPCTQFLITVKSTTFTFNHASDEENDAVSPPTSEYYSHELQLDLLMDENASRAKLAEALLSELHCPPELCAAMVDKVANGAVAEEASSRPFSDFMLVHIEACLDVFVEQFGGSEEEEATAPKFVPASRAAISKLETATVEESAVCAVCLEEMAVGSDSTCMPCSHLYHRGCIVEWLQKSRVCPMCRFSLPADLSGRWSGRQTGSSILLPD